MPSSSRSASFDEKLHPRGQPDNPGKFKGKPVPAPPRATTPGRRDRRGHVENFELYEQVLDREATRWRLSADCLGCGTHWDEDHTRDPPDLSDVLAHEAEERRSDWMRQHVCEPVATGDVALEDITLVQADVTIKMSQERIRRARRLGGWLPWCRRDLREADELLRSSRACIKRELQKKHDTNPRVRITDEEALASLDPGQIRSYLEAHGWHRRDLLPSGAGVWVLEAGDGAYEVIAPYSSKRLDYTQRVSELLRTLSIVEDRSELDVLYDIEALSPGGE